MKYKKIFQPSRTRFLHNIAIKDKEFREKLATVNLKNRTLPKENELFTSFLARNATLNFLQTSTFINKYFPEYKNWFLSRDLDVLSDDKFFINFANRFNIDVKVLNKTSLKSYTGYLNEIIYENSRNALISPIKIKGLTNKLNGLKYCPLCLQEENYFKKEWRLSFYTVCPKHKTIMLDRCPQCGEPLTITRRKYDIEEFNCWNCGFVFKDAPVEFVNQNSKSVKMLEKVMDILNKGWFEFDDNIYYSISYFKVVKHLSKLIYNRGFRENYTLSKELEYLNIELPNIKLTSSRFMEDFIEVKESLVIFTAIFEILENSKNLISFIKTNKIPIYELNKDFVDKAFFYDNIIWQFYKQSYSPPYNEVKSAIKWMIKNNIIWQFYKQSYSPPYNEVKSAIKWMIKNNIPITWSNLSDIFGVYLDKRKRPELVELIIKNKKGF